MKGLPKKILATLLTVVMLLTAAPLNGFVGLELPDFGSLFSFKSKAAETSGTCGENLTWSFDDSTGTLTIGGTGAMADYTNVAGVPWRSHHSSIKSVIIGNGVTSIGNFALYYFGSLASVTIANTVTSIGDYAFGDCNAIKNIIIPDSVKSIGIRAFGYCLGLTSVTIGAGLESMGEEVFYDCESLTDIIVSEDNLNYSSDEYGVLFDKAKTMIIHYPVGITSASYEIPASVKSIGDRAFYGCTNLTSITIGNSVTSIGNYAFRNCANLASITIGNSVTSIGNYAFYYCENLTDIVFEENSQLSSIGMYAFGYLKNLSSITIPDSVTAIGPYAFYYCANLTSVTFGENSQLSSIGDDAFYNCSGLTSITIPASVTSIGDEAFYNCSNLESITIPNNVTSIGEYAFYSCTKLASITFDENSKVLRIGVYAFGNTAYYNDANNWTDNVLYIDDYLIKNRGINSSSYSIKPGTICIADSAFSSSSIDLRNVTIPDSVISIGAEAFSGCWLDSITIPAGVINIGDNAFYFCKFTDITVSEDNKNYSSEDGVLFNKDKTTLIMYAPKNERTEYTIPNSVTTIGERAFYSCSNLKSIVIPDSVTVFGNCTFESCSSLSDVTFGNGITSIVFGMFSDCDNITNITLPNSITSIDDRAFYWCSGLKSIYIPNGVTSIGEAAFVDCNKLESLTIPASVTDIDDTSFAYCDSLTDITVSEDNENYSSENGVLFNKDKTTLILYSAKSAKTEYTVPDSVTTILDYAFCGCSNLLSLTIPNGIEVINDYVFYESSSLTSIKIPDSVKSIGRYAFYGCSNLESITIPDSVKSIGFEAFYGCSSLESITIPDSVTSIGYSAFYGCSSLKSITIPDSVTSIGSSAFYGCSSLESITIPDSVTSIGYSAFYGCSSLKSITIPDSVTSIGSDAFYGCKALTDITIPGSVTNIGSRAFYGCSKDLVVYCFSGSYAEAYAIENGLNVEGIVFNNISLSISIENEKNEKITSGFSVKWYEKGSDAVIAEGVQLTGAETGKTYEYEIILDDDLSKAYYAPERGEITATDKAVYPLELSCALKRIPEITVKGKVTDSDGKALAGVKVVSTQTVNEKYIRTQQAITDENGLYSLNIAKADAKISFSLFGYYSKNLTITGLAENEAAEYNAGTVALSAMPQNKITLSLTKLSAAENPDDSYTQSMTSFYGIEFTLFNVTQNKAITSFSAQYPNIIIGDAGVNGGDVIRVTATDTSKAMTAQPVEIALTDLKVGNGEIIFTENGKIKINSIISSGKTSVMVFNSNGLVETYIEDGSFVSEPLEAGGYKLVLIEKTSLLRNISSISKLTEIGLTQGTDYIVENVNIVNGAIAVIDSVTVPDFDESKLFYTVKENTSFAANSSTAVAGKYIVMRAEYKIDPKYQTTGQYVTFDLPEGVSFTDGSLALNGKVYPYTKNGNEIKVFTNDVSGTVRFYVYATESGTYNLNAYLGFKADGSDILQPIGTASFTAEADKISVPKKTGRKNVLISGTALPNSTVTVYDNGTEVGKTTPNKNGTWSMKIDLVKPYSFSYHEIYASIANERYEKDIQTSTETLLYNENSINLSKITMINRGDNGENVSVFDFLNKGDPPSYRMFPGVYTLFSFKVEFTGGDDKTLSDVYVVTTNSAGEKTYIPVTYDAKSGLWLGTHNFNTFGEAPVAVSAVWKSNQPVDENRAYSTMLQEGVSEENSKLIEAFNNEIDDMMNVEIKEENDDYLLLEFSIGDEDIKWEAVVEDQDYSQINIASLEEQGFILCESDTPDEKPQYIKFELTDGNMVYTLVDTEHEFAFKFTTSVIDNSARIKEMSSNYSLGDYGSAAWKRTAVGLLENLPIPGVSELSAFTDRNNISKLLCDKREEMNGKLDNIAVLMTQKCKDTGEPRLSETDLAEFQKRYKQLLTVEGTTYNALESSLDLYAKKIENAIAFDLISFGLGKIIGAAGSTCRVFVNSKNAKYTKYILRTTGKVRNVLDTVLGGVFKATTSLGQFVDGWSEFFGYFDIIGNDYYLDIINQYDNLFVMANQLQNDILLSYNKCGSNEEELDEPESEPENPNPENPDQPVKPILDPSGYVYEAVPSNRVEGVKAEAYYYDYPLDEFGMPAESKQDILWDATEYDQVNPLYTDANGMYAWDVPVGQWLVKFSKDGYYDTDSRNDIAADDEGYLPVPPPQTEVNTAIVSKAAPTVASINAYDSEIQIIFSQYMKLNTVNSTNVVFKQNGNVIMGSITPANAEYNYEQTEQFASIFTFVPETNISGTVDVEIKNVINYAGKAIASAYSTNSAVTVKPTGISIPQGITMLYGEDKNIDIQILPAEAGKNLTLDITTSSPSILAAKTATVTTDENGNASIPLSALLPGESDLTITISDTDISTKTTVVIEMESTSTTQNCQKVVADISSNTEVKCGTQVTLSTPTDGAEIYYTLDKTCPCVVDSSSRIKYTGPITINEDMYIIAYAVKDGYEDSATSGFYYTVSHAYATFAYSQTAHPHYAVYRCECGEEKVSDETKFIESCSRCNPQIVSIEISQMPVKLDYNYKSTISHDGLQVTAIDSNGDKTDITDKVTVNSFDTSSTGTKTATISYTPDGAEEPLTTTFEYTVKYTWWQWIIRILLLGIFWY